LQSPRIPDLLREPAIEKLPTVQIGLTKLRVRIKRQSDLSTTLKGAPPKAVDAILAGQFPMEFPTGGSKY
jgi:hypothetical protein